MKLQERFSTLSPIYSGGLTNHLPMMITALRLLDVEDSMIEQIAEEYVNSKNIMDLSNSGIENDPFGDEYIRLTNYFMNEFEDVGIEQTMRIILNGGKFSLHSGLFHGLIRIAYAYLENNDLLIAQGLAYFKLIEQELKLVGSPSDELVQSFEKMIPIRKEIDLSNLGSMEKINTLLKNEDLKNKLFYPKGMISHKEKAVQFYLDYFNKTKDFFILHAITGYHALHVLSQFFDNEEEVFENFFMQTVLVLLINPHDVYELYAEKGNLMELNRKSHTLRDAHDIKLFFSLCYFYERYEIEELKIAANLIFTK